jgi:hypothetical protein
LFVESGESTPFVSNSTALLKSKSHAFDRDFMNFLQTTLGSQICPSDLKNLYARNQFVRPTSEPGIIADPSLRREQEQPLSADARQRSGRGHVSDEQKNGRVEETVPNTKYKSSAAESYLKVLEVTTCQDTLRSSSEHSY